MSEITSTILVASDDSSDAELVRKLLSADFASVFTSTNENNAVADFEKRRPAVLVLAFKRLEHAERFSLGLYRMSRIIQGHPHRTVILCNKDEVKHVADLCLKRYFDDYILFWPMNYDAPRLTVSVHLALRAMSEQKDAGPSVAEFAAQARQLAELEALLELQLAQGGKHIDAASHAMKLAQQNVGAALDGFSSRLSQPEFKDVLEIKNAEGMQRELNRLKQEEIARHLSTASAAAQPLKQWNDKLREDCAPMLASARALNEMAERVKPIVLVVDDDEFQHKLVAKILGADNYQMMFAASGAEAMTLLRTTRPDLILMDVMMPDLDGLEMTNRLKAIPHLAGVPIMMISGKSEGNVVVGCLKAGAVDFAVKPFDLESLKSKVARWARPKGVAKPAPPAGR